MSPNYVIITPVRNEGQYLQKTIDSVVSQTVRPQKWIIVNDGSTDSTPLLIGAAAKKHTWIKAVHRPDRGFRKSGGGVIDAFYDGYALLSGQSTLNPQLSTPHWDFLVKLDGDLSFGRDYFEKCLSRFCADERLGIAGGRVHCNVNGAEREDSPGDPAFHVRGATKIYRRETWSSIGGLLHSPGWDTLDEVKANMLGWKTYSFQDLHVLQLKPTGAADGTWKNWFKNGRANYVVGYHPLFMISKCLRRLFAEPLLIGAVGLWFGYFTGLLCRIPQVPDQDLIHYLRKQQISRLLLRPSLWSA